MSLTDPSYAVHFDPMARRLLSHGQDLDRIYVQHPGQDWLGYYGGTRFHYAFVLDVRSTEAGGD